MAVLEYRLFFDTSTCLAGLLSSSGAARELLRLAECGAVRMVVSEEVITEMDRVIAKKFPNLIQESRKLWKDLQPDVVPNPSVGKVRPFLEKLDLGDARILCAARESRPEAFVTWNTHDFMSQDVSALVDFPIVVPSRALELFRLWIEPFLD